MYYLRSHIETHYFWSFYIFIKYMDKQNMYKFEWISSVQEVMPPLNVIGCPKNKVQPWVCNISLWLLMG